MYSRRRRHFNALMNSPSSAAPHIYPTHYSAESATAVVLLQIMKNTPECDGAGVTVGRPTPPRKKGLMRGVKLQKDARGHKKENNIEKTSNCIRHQRGVAGRHYLPFVWLWALPWLPRTYICDKYCKGNASGGVSYNSFLYSTKRDRRTVPFCCG